MEEIKIPTTRKEPVFIVQGYNHAVIISSGYPFHMLGDIWYAVHNPGRWYIIHKASGLGGTPRYGIPIKTRAQLIRLLNDETYQEALEKALSSEKYGRSSEFFKDCVAAVAAARRQYYEEKEALKNAEDNQGR